MKLHPLRRFGSAIVGTVVALVILAAWVRSEFFKEGIIFDVGRKNVAVVSDQSFLRVGSGPDEKGTTYVYSHRQQSPSMHIFSRGWVQRDGPYLEAFIPYSWLFLAAILVTVFFYFHGGENGKTRNQS